MAARVMPCRTPTNLPAARDMAEKEAEPGTYEKSQQEDHASNREQKCHHLEAVETIRAKCEGRASDDQQREEHARDSKREGDEAVTPELLSEDRDSPRSALPLHEVMHHMYRQSDHGDEPDERKRQQENAPCTVRTHQLDRKGIGGKKNQKWDYR
ncbi:hypothetical protein [Trinickia symbiotica]|uniref:hypothetical protein n=1 Tax=Trinickia symbiotica TaxID=863227 RepID=UPI0011B2151B|nr:hypothetical protein [Trinickia symbiotica]